MSLSAVLARIDENFAHFVEKLDSFSRIPGISAEPAPSPALADSAARVCEMMREVGLLGVRVMELEGAHPYAYGEWLQRPGAPTLLLYAHHDVQPTGRDERWLSPPFEPEIRDGRMYGRGVVDDKAGVLSHLAAIAAWMQETGALPCNVKFIVEGEEETGSEHLEEFLAAHAELLAADCILLTDTANLDTGIPSITTRLRGLVGADIKVRGLKGPLHSGMWGGPVPDPVMALVKILARLTDAEGEVAIPGFWDEVREPSPEQREQLNSLPFDAADFKRDAGMLEGMEFSGSPSATVYEKLWFRPVLSINGLISVPVDGASNQITDSAQARVSIRLVPDQDPERCRDLLVEALRAEPPFGVEVEVEPGPAAIWWSTEAQGPAFEAAARAMELGFDKPCTFIGCGGTIPFVTPFARVLGGIPAVLLGLEDPACAAHAENESLHLGDWRKGMRATAALYEELREVLGGPLQEL
ncbi:MAG: dipeptidase [Rickettsiales bacterium]|nr:dipeptidase [Rickettsiales bacterium]|tara:strand:+ start:674 stop:2083 length:1410 start_codon:yes stop_codon:yes gene_type:complete